MSTEATDIGTGEVVVKLQEILADVWSGNEGRPVDAELPLRDAGVDSGAVVAFLARAQSAFDVEWPEDLPPGALESVSGVARTIVHCRAQS
ncbi:MAG TPA: acyl carrier protein [Candidatus Dormibacteraeota bacterium]